MLKALNFCKLYNGCYRNLKNCKFCVLHAYPRSYLLQIRKPCPSIIYEIIMMQSVSGSGNFKGSFVVSISYANMTGS